MKERIFERWAKLRDEIWKTDPHYRGFMATLTELNKETDRGVALVTTSFLDMLMRDAIAAFLIDNSSAAKLLAGFNAPLGSLSTRIAACHALGLITDEEAKQSDILRKVRNEFAHKIEVTFENGAVKDLCNNLSVPESDKDAKARAKFAKASMLLLIRLINRPAEVSQMRLKCVEWGKTDLDKLGGFE
ncbi:transcriptional regulator [Bradyrhizobium barranii subsp. barranii]|uniref:Transcriptional regulator n=1 Tax=Bradyrhizobium barranii subsp. barranii TaxID=2823807 RepID=A0A7Z0TL18_9BRAD|nr:transcriptional regulator [Bradyrhizobium barranii]UGX95781.1 transcriptional regulator [Bradyrhizobium barranii subsp. barranii]